MRMYTRTFLKEGRQLQQLIQVVLLRPASHGLEAQCLREALDDSGSRGLIDPPVVRRRGTLLSRLGCREEEDGAQDADDQQSGHQQSTQLDHLLQDKRSSHDFSLSLSFWISVLASQARQLLTRLHKERVEGD